MVIWYGLVPVTGAFAIRRSWRLFRRRFNDLRLVPLLDYGACRRLSEEGKIYRFTGGFESVTEDKTLWIRSDNLTIPVALAGAHTYVLPMQEQGQDIESFDPREEAPEQVRWDRVSSLTEGAKVFVGGALMLREDRWTFVSRKETPLLIIFYDGPDRSLAVRAIRAGRHHNEYWNAVTPYALALGAVSLIYMALSFLSRPAFRLTVVTALIAVFTPLYPLIPPGILCTVLYRRCWWRARIYRAYRDLARLPLKYLEGGQKTCVLPGGELYGSVYFDDLPPEFRERKIPLLLPETEKRKKEGWYVFGVLNAAGTTAAGGETIPAEPDGPALPVEPSDIFAAFGAIPGKPEALARRYTLKAYTLEIVAWLVLLAGIGLNVFFIRMIIILL
ncbi:MAG: hypothetical protein LBP23_08780 [Treponema sp.]|nr:hypothetical protein [Treponema sp.]